MCVCLEKETFKYLRLAFAVKSHNYLITFVEIGSKNTGERWRLGEGVWRAVVGENVSSGITCTSNNLKIIFINNSYIFSHKAKH